MWYLKSTIKEIFRYIRQYKSRTAMTMFGLIWGMVTLVVLLAFSQGVKRAMSASMHGMGEAIVIVWPGSTSLAFQGYSRDRQLRFREEDALLLKMQIPEMEAVSPEYSTWDVPIRVEDRTINPNISGVIPEYGPIRHVWPEKGGRWLNELDIGQRRRVIFLGNKLKEYLFGKDQEAVGQYVYVDNAPFLVVGVLKEKIQNSSYSAQDQDRAFIPASTFCSFFGKMYINNMVYKVKDPRNSEMVKNRVYEVLGRRFTFDPKDKQALGIWDTTEMDKFVFYFSLGFTMFMGIIGVFTLTVGGIGLANIMYVVVQERTREIGIRRAVGAKQSHIMSQFVLESLILIGVSAFVGFLLSFGLVKILSLLPIDQYIGRPVVSLPVWIVSVLVLGSIGFLAGYFPARKALSIEVADALRY